MKNKYILTLALLTVLTLGLWCAICFAVLALVAPARAAAQTPIVTKMRMPARQDAIEAEKDIQLEQCSTAYNAARVVADDRLSGVQKERELAQVVSSPRLTPANRAMYRMIINDIYALPEQQIRRYPSVMFGECIAGVR